MRNNKLRPLPEIILNVKESTVKRIEELQRDEERKIKQIERNRSLLADLVGAGIDVGNIYSWETLETMEIPMGTLNTMPGKKASAQERKTFLETFKKVREIVGAPIKQAYKSLESSKFKTVKITMHTENFPGVDFTYVCKLPKDSKCKIVRAKYRSYSSASLVCDV